MVAVTVFISYSIEWSQNVTMTRTGLILMACFAALSAGCRLHHVAVDSGRPPALTKDDVLSIREGRFHLDGKPFAEISFNKFDLLWQLYDQLAKGNALNDTDPMVQAQDRALRNLHEMGFRSIRFFALPWGPRGPESYADPEKRKLLYAALDKAMELCDKHDIRVVWSLGAGTFTDTKLVPGKGWVHREEQKRELISDPESRGRKLLYQYIDETVARYKNRKTILMWEISNEVTLSADIGNRDRVFKGQRMPTLKDVAGFFDDVARRIKAADPLRLVNSGGSHMRESQWNLYQRRVWDKDTFEEQFKCIELLYGNSAVDVIDIHSYPNHKGGYTIMGKDGKEALLVHKGYTEMAARLDKPLMIGELGLHAAARTNKKVWEERPGYFESYSDAAAARPWVKKTLNSVIDAGVQLSYWWCYQSDRPMDQKNQQRFDLSRERNPELLACFVEANKRLKAAKEKATMSTVSPVRVQNGKFVLKETGAAYVPRGFNYVRLDLEGKGGHATFSPFVYDRARVVAAFQHMAENGFNVVRVFLNGLRGQRGCMFQSRDAAAPDPKYLDNLAEFLLLAGQHGILVVPCFDFFPEAGPYRDGLKKRIENVGPLSNHYLNQAFINAKKRYLRDVIRELRKRDPRTLSAVFCWDLMNEVCYHLGQPPFSLDQGRVTPANGVTYNLATDKERLADDMAVYWIDQMASAIRAEIPDALINANVFTYHAVGRNGPGDFRPKKAVWQNRYPFRPTALLRSKADVIDIHIYAADEAALNADMKSIEHDKLVAGLADAPNRALIIGEFGVFKRAFPELTAGTAWAGKMTRRFPGLGAAGWIYWTYDTDEQKQLWNAMSGHGAIFNKLKSKAIR
ncbi:MAG: cellulase family glycosylhydrolase [Planctomycetota bacterium]|jgi:hypothetical protein|nr:cellulase family glycosylhydrolase [Planctomycetota bacterium]